MSIATAENAGLGPGDLPDLWATTATTTTNTKSKNNRNTNTTKISNNNNNNKASLLNEAAPATNAATTTTAKQTATLQQFIKNKNNHNNNNNSNTASTTTTSSKLFNNFSSITKATTKTLSIKTNNNNIISNSSEIINKKFTTKICNLPISSPAVATAAVSVPTTPAPTGGGGGGIAASNSSITSSGNTKFLDLNNFNLSSIAATAATTTTTTTTFGGGGGGGVASTAIAVANTAGNPFGSVGGDGSGSGGGGSGSGERGGSAGRTHNALTPNAAIIGSSSGIFQQQQQPRQIQGNNNHNNIVVALQQQQQQHQLININNKNNNNNNNNNINTTNNNNNLNLNNLNNNNITNAATATSALLQQQQQQQHKAAATVAVINFSAALQQQQQQQQQRSTIMNAVASPISTANSTASTNRKIRRKTDAKANLPQSQINKCNNEKRRRELENNYIEQLSEFLQLNKRGDMTSTKPDKAAILNQVVKTYRDICDKGQSRDISSSTTTTTAAAATSSSASSSSSSTSSTSSTTSTTSASTTLAPSTQNSSNNSNLNQQPQTTSTRCTRCATDNCSIHPVQQGEVSSTEPPLPEPLLLNGQAPEISAYFEALEHYISSVGWVLLQVNADGIIESCTQNIRELIGYEKQDLFRKPLYMYLYPGDHAKLDPIINNMSYSGNGGGGAGGGNAGNASSNTNNQSGISPWASQQQHHPPHNHQDQDDSQSQQSTSANKTKRSISTKVRMLVKDVRTATQTSTALNDAMDQKQKFEEVVLIAAPVKDDGDSASSVLCLITRPEDESPLEMNIQQHVPQQPIEQMTFKLDIHGKILNMDATALREPFRQHLSKCIGRLLQDICHPQDLSALKAHLRDIQDSAAGVNAVSAAQSPGSCSIINPPISNVISRPFRLRLGAPDVYMHVKANSRLFLNQTPDESDFIMSVQTILNTENDMNSNNTAMMGGVVGGGNGVNIGSNSLMGMGNASAAAGLLTAMSPGSSLVSSLVSTLSMDSSSSPLVAGNPHLLGGLVGGGGGMQPQHHNTQTTNVGGPLMTSAVINGTGAGPGPGGGGPGGGNGNGPHGRNNSSSVTSNNSSLVNSFAASPTGPEAPSFYSNDPFGFDLEHSSFDMDPAVTGWTDSRPNSRASVVTPVSTPRPPSTGHGFSPAICASPSTPYQLSSHSAASLPSPQSNASQSGQAGGGPSANYGFSFPNFDASDKEKDNMNNNNNNNNNSNNNNSNSGGLMLGSSSNLPNGGPTTLLGGGQQAQLPPQTQQPPPPQQTHESERLRHLLMNKSHSLSSTSSMQSSSGQDNDDKDHMMKFYKQNLMSNEEDKEGGGGVLGGAPGLGLMQSGAANMFKMGMSMGGGMPGGRLYGGTTQKISNTNNPMLLSLLNEKSEDDESKGGSSGRQSELMRQLQKDEDLRCMLKIQADPAISRKRSLNEPDDGVSAKRPEERPQSKLREKNKMLALLLENPPKNPVLQTPLQIKTIPDINPSSVNRVTSTLGSAPGTTTSIGSNISGVGGVGNVPAKSAQSGSGRGRKQTSDTSSYLNQQQQQRPQQQQQQQAPQQQQQMSFATTPEHAFATPPHNTQQQQQLATSAAGGGNIATSTATSQSQSMSMSSSTNSLFGGIDNDSELSKILDSVMEYVADDQAFVPTTPPATVMSGLTQQEINERMAISLIQKTLMFETSTLALSGGPSGGLQHAQLQQQQQQQQQQLGQQQQQQPTQQPPAYPGNMLGGNVGVGGGNNMAAMTPQQQHQHQQMLQMLRSGQANPAQQQAILEAMRANANQVFHRPPPIYTARGRVPMNAVATPGGGVMPASQQYRASRQQQLAAAQQKERLLQQQQKQQLLVPESATARSDQLCMNPGINNIGNLLNTTVAPNVSLSRTNLPPDSQLSPNFAQNMQQMQQQLSPGQRCNTPFTTQGYAAQFSQNQQRLSPQQQQQLTQQQQQMSFPAGAAQLSPRQPPFGNAGGVGQNAGGVQSPGMPPNASPQQWANSGAGGGGLAAQRGGLQQVNPMLSAQLQGVAGYNARQFQNQRRGLNSPGTPGGVPGGAPGNSPGGPPVLQRQNSFQTAGGDGSSAGFSAAGTPGSPSPQSPYGAGAAANVFQQQQMQRMQRQASVPQATQHLPGSPRSFGHNTTTVNSHLENAGNPNQNAVSSASAVMNGVMGAVGFAGGGGGGGGMYGGNMQHIAPQGPQPPNDFYGRTPSAGNAANSSEFVKQELRAVVSGRAQQQTAAAAAAAANAGVGGNGVPGGGGGGGGGGVPQGNNAGLRVSAPQSPIGQLGQQQQQQQQQQVPMLSAGLSQQQQQNVGNSNSSLLNTQNDPFNFDAQDFFGTNATR